jgi:hypothetical protein
MHFSFFIVQHFSPDTKSGSLRSDIISNSAKRPVALGVKPVLLMTLAWPQILSGCWK